MPDSSEVRIHNTSASRPRYCHQRNGKYIAAGPIAAMLIYMIKTGIHGRMHIFKY